MEGRKLQIGDLVVDRFEYYKLGLLGRSSLLPPAGVIVKTKQVGKQEWFLVSWSGAQLQEQYWADIDLWRIG